MLVLVAALVPAGARAQDEDPERAAIARSLFHEGLELARGEQYRDAADRFRRAYALRPAPAIGFNLASALAHDGALVEATEVLRRTLRDPELDGQLRSASETMLQELERRVGRLTVRVSGPREGVQVSLGERALPEEVLGVAIPVDPGSHVVTARRGEDEVAQSSVDVAEGASAEVELAIPELPAVTLAEGPTQPAQDQPSQGGDDTAIWVGVGIGAAVAIGVAVTLAVLLVPADAPDPFTGNTMPGVIEW